MRACRLPKMCAWCQFPIAQVPIEVWVMRCAARQAQHVKSKARRQNSARSSRVMNSEDCAPKCAAAPIDSMMNAQSIKMPKPILAWKRSGFVVLERGVILVDSANWIVVGIFNFPLELRANKY